MPDRPSSGLFRILGRKQQPAYTPVEELRHREMAEGLAVLEEVRRTERDERLLAKIVSLWPLFAGIAVSVFAPVIQVVLHAIGPWAMTLVFPFVVLAQRPELQAGPITHQLPTVMLYAQFPIEGLLARMMLRPSVRPVSVALQVLLFHFLGIFEVWMLNGVVQQLLGR